MSLLVHSKEYVTKYKYIIVSEGVQGLKNIYKFIIKIEIKMKY